MKKLTLLFLAISISPISYAQKSQVVAEGAELTLIFDQFSFTEGPAVDKDGNVYFTDQPNDKIIKWSEDSGLEIYLDKSFRANGLYFDHEGNLLACADEKNQLIQIAPDKSITVLLDDFKGKRLNGPNDLWVDANGGIYFTDPFYKRPYWSHSEKEIEEERVYYFTSNDNKLVVVANDLVKPNGIIGSRDGTTLYVADIGDQKTYSYSINKDGSLTNKKLFTELGSDGMTLDNQGNLYLTGDGVIVFNKNGEQIEHISVSENWTANVTFGGTNQQTLFITASKSLYTLEMKVMGIR